MAKTRGHTLECFPALLIMIEFYVESLKTVHVLLQARYHLKISTIHGNEVIVL